MSDTLIDEESGLTLTDQETGATLIVDGTESSAGPPPVSFVLNYRLGMRPLVQNLFFRTGDTFPALAFVLAVNDSPINLNGATVVFRWWPRDGGTTKTRGATVTDASAGECSVAWDATDLDTAGTFLAEVQVTFEAGGKMSFPGSHFLWLVVR